MTVGILPNVSFIRSESGVRKFGNKCSFPHRKVEDKPNKGGDKSAVAVVKDVRQLGCVLQDTEPRAVGSCGGSTAAVRHNNGPRPNISVAKVCWPQRVASLRWLHASMQAAAQAVPAEGESGGCVRCSGTNGSPSAWPWPGPGSGARGELRAKAAGPSARPGGSHGRLRGGPPLAVVPSLAGGDGIDDTTVRVVLLLQLAVKKEWEEERAQKTPPPGARPGILAEPGPQRSDRSRRHLSGDAHPTLGLPVLAGESGEVVDVSTLAFLTRAVLEEKRKAEVEKAAKEKGGGP